MLVQAVPLSDFIHGSIKAFQGRPIEIEESVAEDLERVGLLRLKIAPNHQNKMMRGFENKGASGKAPAAGQDTPSPSLPAAPVSPSTTLHLPKRGPGRPRKDDTP